MEDGSLVTSDAIREAANKLDDALKAVSEGSFKPDREKDELTYTLGTPKHTGRVRGMGVVLAPTNVTTGKTAMTPAAANLGWKYFMNHE